MAAVEYGTVAVIPKGEWSATTQYDVGNLVSYDGSSYVAKILPPLGTLPTDLNYWQVSAQGMGKATADTLGTVKPDGTTTEVNGDGQISAKTATQTTLGIVKGSNGITIGSDGNADVNTEFTQAAELANIIAGEAIAAVLGKVSKAIATTMNLDQNALLKNMMTSINVNDANKIPTAALTYAMQQAISRNEDNIAQLNSNLAIVIKDDSVEIHHPDQVLKNQWNSLPIGSYTIRIGSSAEYGCYVYKLSNRYGTATIWGYIPFENISPWMLKLYNGVWHDYTYVLDSDLAAIGNTVSSGLLKIGVYNSDGKYYLGISDDNGWICDIDVTCHK